MRTNGFEVEISDDIFILKVDLWTDSIRNGALAMLTTMSILMKIIDDYHAGKIDEPESIPTFSDFIDCGMNLDEIDDIAVPIDELSVEDFSPGS